MYHKIEDQERNPDAYVLTHVDPNMTEDECHDFVSKPRQTQRTIGLYLKKVRDAESSGTGSVAPPRDKKCFTLTTGNHTLEAELMRNKGFWVGQPQTWSHLVYKLKDRYSVNIPRKSEIEQGIFLRPRYMELDHHIKLAKAGLLYSDEEELDSEEEFFSGTSACFENSKQRQRKKGRESEHPKNLMEEIAQRGEKPRFKKIPTGCQCDYYGTHNEPPTVWDNPFRDRMDMLRQHEMNKYMKPFKCEILNKNYEKNPPVKFMSRVSGMKKTFPIYLISNL